MKGMFTKNISIDGSVFYFNSSQNKSLWKPPADAIIHEAANLKQLQETDTQNQKNIEAMHEFANTLESGEIPPDSDLPVNSGSILPLPPGWMQLLDQSSGRPYFVNQVTGQTQWESPAGISGTEADAFSHTVKSQEPTAVDR